MDAAWSIVDAEVRGVVRERGIDPTTRRDEVRAIAESVVAAYEERALVSSVPDLGDPRAVVAALVDAVAGFGPLQRYLDDPEVEEIWINDPSRVFVARAGRSELTPTLLSAAAVRDLVERMLRWSGRRLDLSSPFVDAMLPDGSRLHVVIPDVTREHWAVNIRKSELSSLAPPDQYVQTASPPAVRGESARSAAPKTSSTAARVVLSLSGHRCEYVSSVSFADE